MPQNTASPVMAGDRYWVLGDEYVFKATGSETANSYAAFEAKVFPDHGTPPHTHTREQESFYILEGEVEFTIAGETRVARTGDFVHAPKDVQHCFWNRSGHLARMLITVVPAGLENYFAEIGSRVEGESAPPPDLDKVMSAASRYGLIVALPPPEVAS